MPLNEDDQARQAAMPFHSQQSTFVSKLEDYARIFSQVDRSFDIQSTSKTSKFLARSAFVQAGTTGIFTAVHTSLIYTSSRDEPFATFLLPFLGQATFTLERRRYRFIAGETALFMPGQARHCETQLAGGTLIKLSRERLAAQAEAMTGKAKTSEHFLASFERPWEFSEAVPMQKHLLSVIRRTIGLIDLAPIKNKSLPDHLGIDDLFYRCVSLLAHPELLSS
jgi:hypothetical protein